MEITWIRPKVHLIKRRGYEDVEEEGGCARGLLFILFFYSFLIQTARLPLVSLVSMRSMIQKIAYCFPFIHEVQLHLISEIQMK